MRDVQPGAWRWQRVLLRLYDSLTRNDPVQPVDLIFVLAGRMERKQHGLNLLRANVAPRLRLSIGRFEVSKMHRVHIGGLDALIALRDKTPPAQRHFFMDVDASGTHVRQANLWRWNTYGEALELRRQLQMETARRIIVLSTDLHLGRVAFTFDRVLRNAPVELLYCAVPDPLASLKREMWWTRSGERRMVISELIKAIGYRIILPVTMHFYR